MSPGRRETAGRRRRTGRSLLKGQRSGAALLRWGGRVGLSLVLVCAVVYGVARATTDRFGASRAIAWLEADTEDIHRFPSRAIPAGDDVLELPAGGPLDLAAVWPTGDPESFLEDTRTAAFLVVQDGAIRYEGYFNGTSPEDPRTSFSVAKSAVSTLIGLAIADGAIGSVDEKITDYIPELVERDPRFADITIRHLLTMSSGLRYAERSLPWSDDVQTYYGTDLRGTALSAKVVEPPGRTFLYNNYNPLLEGLILERATGRRVSDYLSEALWRPMGAEADASWSLDSQWSGFEKMESGLNAVARDYARFGLLFANDGRAGGRQVLPAKWVRLATSSGAETGPADFYALHWWTGRSNGEPLPEGHFMAVGNFGQFVYVAPDRDLVIVRLGDDWGTEDWPGLLARIASRS
ncbi:MAG: serine hydrolase domain-containing protein [Egibacteraceae bacterium]